jgi:PTH1 family peptidyl-tRNA hydrolase
MIQLAAFLGNPGAEYARNRHNAGRMLVQALPFYQALAWQKKFKGLYAALSGAEIVPFSETRQEQSAPPSPFEKIHFLMPETYMNHSGESIHGAASFFKIKVEEILLVHDELELPLGTISLKFSGGLGGHNGLRSMKACCGAADFWRLRIGIGRPDSRLPGEGGHEGSGRGIVDWVLSDFSGVEKELLDPALDAGAGLLLRALVVEPETLLPQWAKKKISG